jgi:hypothetical protein
MAILIEKMILNHRMMFSIVFSFLVPSNVVGISNASVTKA